MSQTGATTETQTLSPSKPHAFKPLIPCGGLCHLWMCWDTAQAPLTLLLGHALLDTVVPHACGPLTGTRTDGRTPLPRVTRCYARPGASTSGAGSPASRFVCVGPCRPAEKAALSVDLRSFLRWLWFP